MSRERPHSTVSSRVRTDAAFAEAVRAASEQRSWNRSDLAAQARLPLTAVLAIYRCAPVLPEAISAVCRCLELPLPSFFDLAPLRKLGQLLRDRRETAGLSRQALGRLAKISDATVKFVETGRNAPSRTTCLRLLSVAELALTWSELAPFAGPPPAQSTTSADPPVFRLDPRLSLELVCEQMLLTDQLRLHQYGLESSLSGWRRVCWLCGTRSLAAVPHVEDAQRMSIQHAADCTGQLAESLIRRYPIVAELAQTERRIRLTPTARALHLALQRAATERRIGCRRPGELGEQLAYASAVPVSPYRRGVVVALLWALDLGPCPLGLTAAGFTQETARGLLAAAAEGGLAATEPTNFLCGVAETVAWILELHGPQPQEPSTAGPQAPSLAASPCPSR